MSTDYQPGTVAIATVRGAKGVRVVLTDGGAAAWMSVELADGCRWHYAQDLTDVRPLVVLDPQDFDTLDRLVALFHESWSGCEGSRGIGLGGALLKLTKPPRIPEPSGPLTEVMASTNRRERRRFVRGMNAGETKGRWVDGVASYSWSELIDPTLIREGLS